MMKKRPSFLNRNLIVSRLGTVVEAKINDRHHDAVNILLENDPQTDSNSERAELATFIHLQTTSADNDQAQSPKAGRHLRKRRSRREKQD